VRDPIRVCQEMSRVARAGYIEVPSLLDELTWANPEPSGGPWVGHCHHRWLCTLERGELVFLPKYHSLHSRRRLRVQPRWARKLTTRERILAYSWQGTLPARERLSIDAYPYQELARAVDARFRRRRAQNAAAELRDRLERSLRWRLGKLRRRIGR